VTREWHRIGSLYLSRTGRPVRARRRRNVMRVQTGLGLALALASGLTLTLHAENWPQWRGPNLDGTSGETNLPIKWSATENIAWKLPLPQRSGATPIVWNDHVLLNVAEGGELFLWNVDRNTGQVRWKARLG